MARPTSSTPFSKAVLCQIALGQGQLCATCANQALHALLAVFSFSGVAFLRFDQRIPMTDSSAPVDVKTLPFKAKLQLLRDTAVRPIRRPQTTLLCATDILAKHASSVSEAERCSIHEQAVVAALECGHDEQAVEFFRYLKDKFGMGSTRVLRLQGLIYEAAGAFENAKGCYGKILSTNPIDPFVAKRLSSMMKMAGDIDKAISVLERNAVYMHPKGSDIPEERKKKYTFHDVHPCDESSYRELISLHWLKWNLSSCVHYGEEVVLLDPANFLHYVRLAELHYTSGDLDQALTCYAHSVRLNDAATNTRGMYGVWLVATELLLIQQRSAGKKSSREVATTDATEYAELLEFSAKKLEATMSGASSPLLPGLNLMFQRYAVHGTGPE